MTQARQKRILCYDEIKTIFVFNRNRLDNDWRVRVR